MGKWYFESENCVSEKREDCFVQNYHQCFYSKGLNVKIAITFVNTMLLRDHAASFRVGGVKEECVKENFFVKLFIV